MNNPHPDGIAHPFARKLPHLVIGNVDGMTIIHLDLGDRSKISLARHSPNPILERIKIHEIVHEGHQFWVRFFEFDLT